MSRDQLSERHEVALALFKYGLASDPDELAAAMRIPPHEARRVCADLASAGLIAGDA
jgi:DNA-binding IclR family transcriptional regulator